MIDRVGCKKAKDALECLRKKDPQELIDAIPKRSEPFVPVTSSEYIPLTAEEITERALGKVPTDMPNINVLLGYAQGEASFYLTRIAPNIYSDAELTTEDALDVIKMLLKMEQLTNLLSGISAMSTSRCLSRKFRKD